MNNTVIKVENLSKQYRLGEVGTGTLSHDLKRWSYKIRGKEDPYLKVGEVNDRTQASGSDYVWALRDINFEVKQGEVLGIIGRNGAGKSTLLKILSKTTTPTTGNIKVKGRIASLLEVGTGFHPEMTGRENIFLNGAILGMTRREIKSKFDEIVDFAGIERYVDTPVKRYSSGMYVRLAFAVAAHLEPEILIVDEVLAVGDAEFQKKCLGKMKDVSVNDGRTVLFVSHNMDAITRLCDISLLMKNGRLLEFGNTEKIISKYLNTEMQLDSHIWYEKKDAPASEIVMLISTEVVDEKLINKVNFRINQEVGIKIVFEVLKNIDDLVIGFNLYNQNDVHIMSSHNNKTIKNFQKGTYSTVVWLPANFLAEGMHYCGIAAMSYTPIFRIHFHDVKKFSFNINDLNDSSTVRGEYTGEFPGIVRPLLKWSEVQTKN
jgi:lipopolysaccharide transport system ATP-binding protein